MKSSVTKPAAAVEQCQVKSRKGYNVMMTWNLDSLLHIFETSIQVNQITYI